MKNGAVVVKGSKEGLTILIEEKYDFSIIKKRLDEKFSSAKEFFSGARVIVDLSKRKPNQYEEREIKHLINKKYGMKLVKVINNLGEQMIEQETDSKASKSSSDRTLIIKRTLRSGQGAKFDGNLVIIGDVNPGAEVVASEDIIVMGNLRGVAHAGALGNEKAIVAAYRLLPTQLRIADKISRSPDGEVVLPDIPEVARIKNGKIYIEPYIFLD
ncbi:MAG: septum site-determining protein MinC [Thermosediminibacterales bacterium]|nr:septum site-determining protein MinC [Thermosediminibacterales bacterium]MDK2835528.1 septum site-determining protein MinC [Thermosediminibacterales bacterium]